MKMMPDSIDFVYDYPNHYGEFIRLQVKGSDGTTDCEYTISSDSSSINITPNNVIETKTLVNVDENTLDLVNKPEIDTPVIFTATLTNGQTFEIGTMNLHAYSVKPIDERCVGCSLSPTMMPLIEDATKLFNVRNAHEKISYWGTEYYKFNRHVYDRFYRLTQVSVWTETVPVGGETYFTAFQWTMETYGS